MKKLILAIGFATLTSLAFAQQAKQSQVYVHLDQQAVPTNLKQVTDNIDYPIGLVEEGIEGRVVYRVLVDKRGRYRNHQLIGSANEALNSLANSELRNLKFEPAVNDGKKVTSWVNIPIVYKIDAAWASK